MRNCYAHVEEQEAFYRRLDGIEELPVEEIDPVDETPEESVQTAVEGALVFEDGQFLVPVEADIEEVLMDVTPNAYQTEIVPTLTCSLCDFTTSSTERLNQHMKRFYECNDCEKTFHGKNGKRAYNRHLVTHQPKTPKPEKPSKPASQPRKEKPEQSHACSKCPKIFTFLSYLERHMESRHGSSMKRKIDFQIEDELQSNSTTVIPSVSTEQPKKRHRKQLFVERKEI